jgi:hypothetical protein
MKRDGRWRNKMNKKHLYLALLTTSMLIMMSSTLIVHAVEYNIFWSFSITPRGYVWQISTVSPIDGTILFSGKDLDPNTIEATIWHRCENNPNLHSHIIEPKKIILTEKLIILVFDKGTLPKSAEYTEITGDFINGIDSFNAVGPSFFMCITPSC